MKSLAFGECLMHKQGSFFAAFIQGFGFDLADAAATI